MQNWYTFIIIVIDCGNLLAPENGNVVVSSTDVGSIATYTCNNGYRIRGVSERECLVNGTWSQEPPICISKLTDGSLCIHNQLSYSY